jgi:hypothetical protein
MLWEEQPPIAQLAGNLSRSESRGVLVTGFVQDYPAIRLVFAWTQDNLAPLILGQVNFFQKFQVCFDGALQVFTLQPRQ